MSVTLTARAMAAALLALMLAACATSSHPLRGTIRIAVDLPLSGREGQQGRPALNGVRFALDREGGQVRDYRVELVVNDDAVDGRHNPDLAGRNLGRGIADPTVLGLVGPLHSTVAQALLPLAAPAHLVIVSPTATDECLTRDLPAPECAFQASELRAGGANPFFRMSGAVDEEATGLATYARHTLALNQLAVASDSSPYGDLLMNGFAGAWAAAGGTVGPAPKRLDLGDPKSVLDFARAAGAGGAQGLFLGGVDSNQVCAVRAAVAAVLPGAFIGGDGILSSRCIGDAGSAAPGMFAISLVPDATHLPSAQPTMRDFALRHSVAGDYGAETIPAYVATEVLLRAIGQAVDRAGGRLPTREAVRGEVARTRYQGPLGPVAFTPAGDQAHALATIYQSGPGQGGLTGGVGGVDWSYAAEVELTPP